MRTHYAGPWDVLAYALIHYAMCFFPNPFGLALW